MSELVIPELPPYVLSLVVVAAGGDSKPVRDRLYLAHSAALRYALEYAGELPAAGERTLREWLDLPEVPPDLFEFCARLLDGVDRRVRGRHSSLGRAEGDTPTPFDRSALLALAQVVSQFGALRRAADAPTSTALARLRDQSPRALQEIVLENYLGNVLHDYFDACEVRAEFPTLPVETEHELRVLHGRAIARAVFAALPPGDGALPPDAVQSRLREAVGLIWLQERALDD